MYLYLLPCMESHECTGTARVLRAERVSAFVAWYHKSEWRVYMHQQTFRADHVPTHLSTHSELSVRLHVFARMQCQACFSMCWHALRAESMAACACEYLD